MLRMFAVLVALCMSVPSAQAQEPAVVRVTLHIDEFGEGKLSVSRTTEPLPPPRGEAVTLKTMPKAKVTKGTGGVFRIEHDFADADDLKQIAMFSGNVEKWSEAKGLVFSPAALQGFEGKVAAFDHARLFRLPITLTCDFAKAGAGGIDIKLQDGRRSFGTVQFRFTTKEKNFDGKFQTRLTWFEFKDGKPTGTKSFLVEKSDATLEDGVEETFRLPLPNQEIEEPFLFQLNVSGSDSPTLVRRMVIEGKLLPSFGIGVKEQTSTVFVDRVMPSSVAEKAGVKTGDVIVAINGEKPESAAAALKTFSSAAIGTEVTVQITRRGQTQTTKITAE